MGMRVFAAVAALLMCVGVAQPAHATLTAGGMFEQIDGAFYAKGSARRPVTSTGRSNSNRMGARKAYYAPSSSRYKVGPRPRKWCGWWMRTQKGGGPKFNVAWNWRHYGRPTGPQIGAVVVWRHHVGMIVGRTAKGQWIVRSGNDSNRVRTRARSVKGAIFRI